MAEVTLIKNPAEQQLAAEWAGGEGASCRAPARLREAAFERFAATGLPHRRVEEWKYTDLRALMREAKPLAPRPDADVFARLKDAGAALGDLDARRIVIADGYLGARLDGSKAATIRAWRSWNCSRGSPKARSTWIA